jgi:hypothetical protein
MFAEFSTCRRQLPRPFRGRRPIRVYVKDDAEARQWEWPQQLQQALGQEPLKIRKVAD